MFLVGLTGGIASGKSTVAKVFKLHGIPVVDADVIARDVVAPGRKAWYKLKDAFGSVIFHDDGTLNREVLADIVFNDRDKRRTLNEITHPEIVKEIAWSIVKYFFQGYAFILLDLPLLFETAYMLDYIYKIIVVTCEEGLQLQRVMERYNINESKAKLRIAAQMPLEKKCEKAHFVLENSGSLDDTIEQTTRIIKSLNVLKHHWKLRIIVVLFLFVILALISFVIKVLL